jgi:hypothetical protein
MQLEQTYDPDLMYDMTHPNRGLFIIINNKVFSPKTQMGERTGTDMDAANLYARFKDLGFNVNIYSNLKAEDMMKVMIDGTAGELFCLSFSDTLADHLSFQTRPLQR